ncbi:hypothetical protein A4A49_60321, partial [Nicotiana attenuata]
MGYSAVTKGYVLYDLDGNRFFINRDVVFKESTFPFQETTDNTGNQIQPIITDDSDSEDTNADETNVPIIEEPHIHDIPTDDISQSSNNLEPDLHITTEGHSSAHPDTVEMPSEAPSTSLHNHHAGPTHPNSLRRSHRESKEPVWLTDYVTTRKSGNSVLYPMHNYVSYATISPLYQTYLCAFSSIVEPTTFQEASKDPRWVEAM